MTDPGPSLLRDAHKAIEAMTAAATLIKQEQWGEAERALSELQSIAAGIAKQVGDKARVDTQVPNPDPGDRG
jgi:hypothetical protein